MSDAPRKMSGMESMLAFGEVLWHNLPQSVMQGAIIAVLLGVVIGPRIYATRSEVMHAERIAGQALCQSDNNATDFREAALQNEVYSEEGQLYEVERYIQLSHPTQRDYVRRDQLRIQLQQLRTQLNALQSQTLHCSGGRSNG